MLQQQGRNFVRIPVGWIVAKVCQEAQVPVFLCQTISSFDAAPLNYEPTISSEGILGMEPETYPKR